MPGSRTQELRRHVDLFLAAASLMSDRDPALSFIAGAINRDAAEFIHKQAREAHAGLRLKIVVGDSHAVLSACDAALLASGTVTLEALFAKTPMVVAYKIAPLSFAIMKRMVNIPHIAMPNVLAKTGFVPEFLQDAAQPAVLANAVIDWLENDARVARFEAVCVDIHRTLRRGGAKRAAQAILGLARAGGD
jgi:lipid-A-disaccharide synthase